MEFLKNVKRRSFLSELLYKILNISFAIAILIIVRVTESLVPAFALVLLSKWRVLAVRPRYWFANIQTNLVDFIVSVGFVIFLSNVAKAEPQRLIIQIIFTLLYIIWLLVIKPRSRRTYVLIQATAAMFIGVTALFSVAYAWPASLVVLLMWLIGYSTARHVLGSYDEEQHIMFLSLIWGLVMAELGWIAYHWTIAYSLPIIEGANLPQVSIISFCLAFLMYKVYNSYAHYQKVRFNDIVLPLIFVISVVGVLLLVFNTVGTGSL